MLRNSFLWLSQNRSLRRWMESSSLTKKLTSRFIAGLRLEDGMALAGALAGQGIKTALDHLGENVTTAAEAKSAGAAALEACRESPLRCGETAIDTVQRATNSSEPREK